MVQAIELLLKEILYRIHPTLIYEDIDNNVLSEKKTVSFQQALSRINNFRNKSIEDNTILFLTKCSKIRNESIPRS
jgi:hypothetical protein